MFRRLFYVVAAMGVPLLAIAGESRSAVPAAISAAVTDTHRPFARALSRVIGLPISCRATPISPASSAKL
jgi:hypothetical protein